MSQQDVCRELPWSSVVTTPAGHLMLPRLEACRLTGAASPRAGDTVATPSGDIPASLPQEVLVEGIPQELKYLEIELVDDLVLRLPVGEHDLKVVVRSAGDSHWFGASQGSVRSLTMIDSFVGGSCARTESGEEVLLAHPTKATTISLMGADSDNLLIGWIEGIEAKARVRGLLRIVNFPMMLAAEVRIGRFDVGSGPLVVESALFAGSLSDDARISCEGSEGRVVLGDTLAPSTTKRLTIEGGQLSVLHGELAGLTMVDLGLLHVGRESDPTGDETACRTASAREAIANHLGFGLVAGVRGQVRELELGHRAIVAGDPDVGFSAERIAAAPTSEISALDARSFNLVSTVALREIRRVGLWVNPSTRLARKHFENEVQQASLEPGRAQFELVHRRKHLLSLAIDTQQDGHTLSVLREAEKDARRAALPPASRERILLELWRWLLGYGERIGYPLLVATPLMTLLGIGHVGWGRFWSHSWWSAWGVDRVEAFMNFALPGVGLLGVDGIGGVWGISAKLVSVIFFATAATAAIRVVRRGE